MSARLLCPDCRGTLRESGGTRLCSVCNRQQLADRSGVLNLQPNGISLTNRSQLEHLAQANAALASVSPGNLDDPESLLPAGQNHAALIDALDPTVADWTLLGDFYNKIVLDIGSGFEALPVHLAARAQEVVAVDPAVERVQFIAQLARLGNHTNVAPIHGQLRDLPIEPKSLDRITMAGQLHRSAVLYDRASTARQSQVLFLEHLRTRLAGDGELWLAVDNRFAPQHLAGRSDHGSAPFAPLLPQSVSRWIHAKRSGTSDPSYFASERALTKMLHEAGYGDVVFHYAVANYSRPRFISSTSQDAVISNYLDTVRQGAGRTSRMAIAALSAADRIGMVGRLAPSFVIRANAS